MFVQTGVFRVIGAPDSKVMGTTAVVILDGIALRQINRSTIGGQLHSSTEPASAIVFAFIVLKAITLIVNAQYIAAIALYRNHLGDFRRRHRAISIYQSTIAIDKPCAALQGYFVTVLEIIDIPGLALSDIHGSRRRERNSLKSSEISSRIRHRGVFLAPTDKFIPIFGCRSSFRLAIFAIGHCALAKPSFFAVRPFRIDKTNPVSIGCLINRPTLYASNLGSPFGHSITKFIQL